MSGQCLCSWCVEARLRARDAETSDLRGLAAYDQARHAKTSAWTADERAEMAAQRERDNAPGIESRWTGVATPPGAWAALERRRIANLTIKTEAEFDAFTEREDRAAAAGYRAATMREARERSGASCP